MWRGSSVDGLKQEERMWVKVQPVIKLPVCGLAAKFTSDLSVSLRSVYFQSVPIVTYYILMYTPTLPPPSAWL